jgi:BspA type Leucine rich repeat region (6 copies)
MSRARRFVQVSREPEPEPEPPLTDPPNNMSGLINLAPQEGRGQEWSLRFTVMDAARVGIPEHITRCMVFDAMPKIRFPLRETPADQNQLLSSATTIRLHPGIDFICDKAFAHLPNLTQMENMSELKHLATIPFCAFNSSTSLTSINLSGCAMLSSIEGFAFTFCEALESVQLPDCVAEIGIGAFAHCVSLESITIPSGVTRIQERTFCDCSSLEHIQIPASATAIDRNAFNWCRSLKTVTFAPEDECALEYLGPQFISNCEELKIFVVPASVISMDATAFEGFSNRIQLPWELHEDGPGESDQVFYPILTMAVVLLQHAGMECDFRIDFMSTYYDNTRTAEDLTELLTALVASPLDRVFTEHDDPQRGADQAIRNGIAPIDEPDYTNWIRSIIRSEPAPTFFPERYDQELVLTQAIFLVVQRFHQVLFITRDGDESDRSMEDCATTTTISPSFACAELDGSMLNDFATLNIAPPTRNGEK